MAGSQDSLGWKLRLAHGHVYTPNQSKSNPDDSIRDFVVHLDRCLGPGRRRRALQHREYVFSLSTGVSLSTVADRLS